MSRTSTIKNDTAIRFPLVLPRIRELQPCAAHGSNPPSNRRRQPNAQSKFYLRRRVTHVCTDTLAKHADNAPTRKGWLYGTPLTVKDLTNTIAWAILIGKKPPTPSWASARTRTFPPSSRRSTRAMYQGRQPESAVVPPSVSPPGIFASPADT